MVKSPTFTTPIPVNFHRSECSKFHIQEVCSAFSRAQEFERQLENRRLEEERSMAYVAPQTVG